MHVYLCIACAPLSFQGLSAIPVSLIQSAKLLVEKLERRSVPNVPLQTKHSK